MTTNKAHNVSSTHTVTAHGTQNVLRLSVCATQITVHRLQITANKLTERHDNKSTISIMCFCASLNNMIFTATKKKEKKKKFAVKGNSSARRSLVHKINYLWIALNWPFNCTDLIVNSQLRPLALHHWPSIAAPLMLRPLPHRWKTSNIILEK